LAKLWADAAAFRPVIPDSRRATACPLPSRPSRRQVGSRDRAPWQPLPHVVLFRSSSPSRPQARSQFHSFHSLISGRCKTLACCRSTKNQIMIQDCETLVRKILIHVALENFCGRLERCSPGTLAFRVTESATEARAARRRDNCCPRGWTCKQHVRTGLSDSGKGSVVRLIWPPRRSMPAKPF